MMNCSTRFYFWLSLSICLLTLVCEATAQEHRIYVDSQLVWKGPISNPDQRNTRSGVVLLELWKKGYLFSQIVNSTDSVTSIHRGEAVDFSVGKISASDSVWEGRFLRGEKNAFRIAEGAVRHSSENGYPFARVQIANIRNDQDKYLADLLLEKGPFISYDTLFLVSPTKTDSRYMEKTLQIECGSPFNESSFDLIEQRISRLPYLDLKNPPDISFEDDFATIYLDLDERSFNSFEGVVGFLPGQSAGKPLLTGYLDLELNNLFQSGKAFLFEWNRFASESQSLALDYRHPFLLETRLLFDVGFSLFKQDTSFVNQEWKLSLGTYFGSSGVLRAGYVRSTGNLITTSLEQLSAKNLVDYERDIYSISADVNNYNMPFGFKSGFKFRTSGSAGAKTIKKNPNIGEAFYDSLQLRSNLIKLEVGIKYQQRVGRQTAVFHHAESGLLYNDQVLNNEMYRIGGLRSMRGFNENFFYTSKYALSRFELRQYFERESYFMLFYDQLYYQSGMKAALPLGFGLGMTLSTSGGLFNFAMAMGKSKDVPFDLSNAKIHFGYISRF